MTENNPMGVSAGIIENHLIDMQPHLIKACKEQRARIAELEAALRCVDDDVRHHLRSDAVAPAMIRPVAVQAVRNALADKKEAATNRLP